MKKKKYKADGSLRPNRIRRAEKRVGLEKKEKPITRLINSLEEMPITRLINSLEGESKAIIEDWIQSDTTLEEDYEFMLASRYMQIAALHLRKARNIAKM